MKKLIKLSIFILFFGVIASCGNTPKEKEGNENDDINLEELQKSDQEKADSVEKYWKDKMNND